MNRERLAKVLIVDDEPEVRDVLHRFLKTEYECKTAGNGKEALEILSREPWDVLVSDIMMPGMSGTELLGCVAARHKDVAVVMITGCNEDGTGIRAVKMGAHGYLSKPFSRDEILVSVAGALELRRLEVANRREVFDRKVQLRERERQIVQRLMSAIVCRDIETGEHIRRIGTMSSETAKALGRQSDAVSDIGLAATMHDLGKIGIPDEILRKPGKLTSHEWELMKEHTRFGARILSGSDVPLLLMARDIALSHHERWDGRGYPHGLAGKAIPESARIVAVADVYDALVHKRPYKAALSEEAALGLMTRERGKHFDPEMLDCFLSILPRIRRIRADVMDRHQREGSTLNDLPKGDVLSVARLAPRNAEWPAGKCAAV